MRRTMQRTLPVIVQPPAEVVALLREELDDDEVEVEVARDPKTGKPGLPKPAYFTFGDEIVLPAHGWDLREANITTRTHNLRLVRTASILDGPTLEVYRKQDPDQPAWAVFVYYGGHLPMVTWMQF